MKVITVLNYMRVCVCVYSVTVLVVDLVLFELIVPATIRAEGFC